jgi:plasmid stabilization system protein ParE
VAEVRWSLTSEDDLQGIEATIARDSVIRAINFVDHLIQCAEVLHDNPRLGRVVPEFARDDLREILVRDYRIVYLVSSKQVTVLRVVHGARDLPALARREPWTFR